MAKGVELILTESNRGGLSAMRAVLAAGAALTLLAVFATPSDAAPRRYWYQESSWSNVSRAPSYAARRARPSEVTTASVRQAAPKVDPGFGEMPAGPLQIIVSIGTQKVTLYSNGVRVAQGGVSTGQSGHPTPLGVFSVIEKDRHHRSNIYSGAPMPFMQRITWSGIALHEGVLPGYPASHGCIRMSHDFAQKLWPTTKLGARVIVARPDLAPTDFAHAKLFAPKHKPVGPQVAMEDETINLVQVAQAMNEGVTVVDVTPLPGDAVPAKQATQASEAPVELGIAAPPAPQTAASDELIELGIKTTQTAPAVPAADDSVKTTGTIAPAQPAEANPSPPAELRRSVEVPEQAEQKPAEAAPASTEPEKPVPAAVEPAKPLAPRMKNADQPQKRYGQVAVFVSRKEKKIFVRQGFLPVFEMPIAIDEPDRPLGTHVFTALGFTDNGAAMRWNLISVPSEPAKATAEPANYNRNRKQQAQAAPKPPAVEKTPSTAAEALDRIQFPAEAIERIGELLIPGSSLVVSDEGLGRETGRGTEFIVLTR